MDDARQRAREAADQALIISGANRGITGAIEAYFDERMRGEPSESLVVEVLRERLTASQRYVAELEAVVRAADAMREELHGGDSVNAFDAARAKVQVPGE